MNPAPAGSGAASLPGVSTEPGGAEPHPPGLPINQRTTPSLAARYLRALADLLSHGDTEAIGRVVQTLRLCRDAGGTIYVAGNGGSAATASHLAADLGKATKRNGAAPFRAVCLNDNIPWLTALGNDEGFERVFAGQLENHARLNDVLVVISASGNSRNLIRAVEVADRFGLVTIGLLGFDGGVLKDLLTECVWFHTPAGAYPLVEDSHSAVCHIITTCLAHDGPPGWMGSAAD